MSSINANWPRWIAQSVIKHFKEKYPDTHLHIEGRRRPNPEPEPRFELRIDGPTFNQVSNNCWHIVIEINVLITSFRDEKDAFKHERLVGIAAAGFTDAISVFKLGTGEDDDPTEKLGCFQEITDNRERERIVISNFGLIESTNQILQSTVEGHYKMVLVT